MSTILKALRRLEEDRQSRSSKTARPVDAIPATDHQAADGLRERILVEESVAQAAADTAEHESDRSRRLIMKGAAAALLTLGLAVAAYTVLWAGIDSGPSPNVIAATPERVPTPETEALPSGEGLAGVESARVSRGQSADSLMPAAPSLARFANSRRSNRPQNDEGNEFGEFQPDQALSDSQGGSQPSTAPPVAVPVPVREQARPEQNPSHHPLSLRPVRPPRWLSAQSPQPRRSEPRIPLALSLPPMRRWPARRPSPRRRPAAPSRH